MAASRMRRCKIVLFLLILQSFLVDSKISDKRLCGDPKCTEPVSYGKTKLKYNSPDADIMSFPSNVDVIIYSKSAGSNERLWGGVINGKRGYFPKNFITESRIIKSNLTYEIPTSEEKTGNNKPDETNELPPGNSEKAKETESGNDAGNRSGANRGSGATKSPESLSGTPVPGYPSINDDPTPTASSESPSVIDMAYGILTSILGSDSATHDNVVAHTGADVDVNRGPTHSAVWFPEVTLSSFGLPGAASSTVDPAKVPPTPQEFFNSLQPSMVAPPPADIQTVTEDGTIYEVIEGTRIPLGDDGPPVHLPTIALSVPSGVPGATVGVDEVGSVLSVSILPTLSGSLSSLISTSTPPVPVTPQAPTVDGVIAGSPVSVVLVKPTAASSADAFIQSSKTTVVEVKASSVQDAAESTSAQVEVAANPASTVTESPGLMDQLSDFLFPVDDAQKEKSKYSEPEKLEEEKSEVASGGRVSEQTEQNVEAATTVNLSSDSNDGLDTVALDEENDDSEDGDADDHDDEEDGDDEADLDDPDEEELETERDYSTPSSEQVASNVRSHVDHQKEKIESSTGSQSSVFNDSPKSNETADDRTSDTDKAPSDRTVESFRDPKINSVDSDGKSQDVKNSMDNQQNDVDTVATGDLESQPTKPEINDPATGKTSEDEAKKLTSVGLVGKISDKADDVVEKDDDSRQQRKLLMVDQTDKATEETEDDSKPDSNVDSDTPTGVPKFAEDRNKDSSEKPTEEAAFKAEDSSAPEPDAKDATKAHSYDGGDTKEVPVVGEPSSDTTGDDVYRSLTREDQHVYSSSVYDPYGYSRESTERNTYSDDGIKDTVEDAHGHSTKEAIEDEPKDIQSVHHEETVPTSHYPFGNDVKTPTDEEQSVEIATEAPRDEQHQTSESSYHVVDRSNVVDEVVEDASSINGGGWYFGRESSDTAAATSAPTESPPLEMGSCSAPGFEGDCREDVLPAVDAVSDVASDLVSSKDSLTDSGNVVVEEPIVEEGRSFSESAADLFQWLKSTTQLIVDLIPQPVQDLFRSLEEAAVSPRVVVFTVIVGSFIFLLQVVYITVKITCKERSLVARICSLDGKLFAAVAERDQLKQQLMSASDSTHDWEVECGEAKKTVRKLQSELKATQTKCEGLQANVTSLEEQLEVSAEAGLELNAMLSEFLTSQNDGGKLQAAVEQLHAQLQGQQDVVADLQLVSESARSEKRQLDRELETIRSEYAELKESYDKLETCREQWESSREELQRDASDRQDQLMQLSQSNDVLLKEAEVWNESVQQLELQLRVDQKSVRELTESLGFKEKELETLKEYVAQLSVNFSNDKVDGSPDDDDDRKKTSGVAAEVFKKLMDVSETKTQLRAALDERDSLWSELEAEKSARAAAEDVVKDAVSDAAKFREQYDIAHREREEAQTKLGVLSNYFKEKELQLQKELGVQSAMRQQTQDNVTSVTHRIAVYEQEIDLLKSQVVSLRAEIDSQERSFKNQVTNHEKKAHENWLAARSAERKLEETKQEATNLRNKLTLAEQERSNISTNKTEATKAHNATYPGSNGEVAVSPRLNHNDRADSMDLPTSGRSSLFREPMDHHQLPFLPADRPMPPPFLMRPPMMLPPGMLPPPPPMHFDPRRGHFPLLPPPPPPPGMLSPEHWGMPPPPAGAPYELTGRPPPFDRRPSLSGSRRTVSPPSEDYPELPPNYSRDFRGNTPPSRYYDRSNHGGGPHPPSPPPLYGSAGVRPLPPPQHLQRDAYPPGRGLDQGINPRTSSPMTSQRQNDNRSGV